MSAPRWGTADRNVCPTILLAFQCQQGYFRRAVEAHRHIRGSHALCGESLKGSETPFTLAKGPVTAGINLDESSPGQAHLSPMGVATQVQVHLVIKRTNSTFRRVGEKQAKTLGRGIPHGQGDTGTKEFVGVVCTANPKVSIAVLKGTTVVDKHLHPEVAQDIGGLMGVVITKNADHAMAALNFTEDLAERFTKETLGTEMPPTIVAGQHTEIDFRSAHAFGSNFGKSSIIADEMRVRDMQNAEAPECVRKVGKAKGLFAHLEFKCIAHPPSIDPEQA